MTNKSDIFKRLCAGMLAMTLASPSWAGLLTTTGIEVLDITGAARASFSNNEKIRMQAKVNNASLSSNFIRFTFKITNPAGKQVFSHTGNAVPGRVGNAATRVSGLPIDRIFTGPGIYTLTSTAELDGQTVSQSATFTVSSPNILLLYPPNGAQEVGDKPLIFRWNSSGATKYRITVGETPSFFNSVFQENTTGGQDFFSYPENPSDSRARLASGTNYYWKVEGLDAAGNVIATSDVPYSFSVAAASLTRDLAVTSLSVLSKTGLSINFRASVVNQGGTTETNLALKFSMGGLPAPGSPVTMGSMLPGLSKDYDFTVIFPDDQSQSLAIACIEFFDDNVANNCKSMQIEKPPVEGGSDSGQIFSDARVLTKEELWDQISKLLQSMGMDFGEYDLIEMDQSLTMEDLQALLDELQRGLADVEVTGPPPDAEEPPAYIPPPVSGGGPIDSVSPELEIDDKSDGQTIEEALAAEKERALEAAIIGKDWRGIVPAMSGRVLKLVLRVVSDFEKFWDRISNEDPPAIDFRKFMLVGVVAGSRERANGLDIEEVRETPQGLQVSYGMMVDASAKVGQERAAVPYHIMVIPRSGLAVDFKRVKRGRGPGTGRRGSKRAGPGKAPKRKQAPRSDKQIWTAIKDLLPTLGMDFSDYQVLEMGPELGRDDLQALVEAIKSGEAQTEVTMP
ncbi:MAG: hypothetical protein COB53_10275 [Elusimicrobia bacterium]|nr:MAG: hypothetical protein COB53_10275 [Elusimicrobiota bacterium]